MKVFVSRIAASLLCALLLAPAAARADGLELTAAFEPAEVEVGQVAHCKVRLKNTGTTGVEAFELAEDRQIISFDVKLDGGRTFRYERITPGPELPKQDWPRTQVAPGAALELDVPFVALTAGKLEATAHYKRGATGALIAPVAALQMKPAAGGATETQVILTTTFGPIRLRLFVRDALGTCLHFARLATVGLRRPHFYDGLPIHRVVPGFMIQMGDPAGNGTGGPGYTIPAEFAQQPIPPNLRHRVGRLSMARAKHDDSAGSQFFICVGDSPGLDGLYTCFGEVERGLDVAFALSSVPTAIPEGQHALPEDQREASSPVDPLRIESIRIVAAPPPTHSQSGRGPQPEAPDAHAPPAPPAQQPPAQQPPPAPPAQQPPAQQPPPAPPPPAPPAQQPPPAPPAQQPPPAPPAQQPPPAPPAQQPPPAPPAQQPPPAPPAQQPAPPAQPPPAPPAQQPPPAPPAPPPGGQ